MFDELIDFVDKMSKRLPFFTYTYNPADFTLKFRIGLEVFDVDVNELHKSVFKKELYERVDAAIYNLSNEEVEDNAESNGKRSKK